MAAEADLEHKLDKLIRERHGFTRKTVYQGRTAAPDRQVFLPGGRIYFIELKAPGKKPRPSQRAEIEMLVRNGFNALVIDSEESLQHFIERIDRGG